MSPAGLDELAVMLPCASRHAVHCTKRPSPDTGKSRLDRMSCDCPYGRWLESSHPVGLPPKKPAWSDPQT